MKIEVHLQGGIRRVIDITPGATKGATIGVDVYNVDGTLFVPSTGGSGGQVSISSWELILNIPPNVVALANTATTGIYVVTGSGTSATRSIVAGDGMSIADGNGVVGNPTVSHADTSSVSNVTATYTGAVVPDVIGFTFDQFGHVTGHTFSGRLLDHNMLNDIQGGSIGQSYHFTAAQHAGLLPWSGLDPSDYALITQTITNGDAAHAPSGDAVFDALALKANIPAGYIDGLPMQWVSGTALTVGSGSAYIEATGNIVQVPTAIAKAGLALAVASWYHVYLYLNAGVPDIEISTTAPVVYSGTARSKTGDSSRRYVGSFKTLASTDIIKFTHNPGTGEIAYLGNINAGPLSVVAGGSATVATTVSCAASVPITGRVAKLLANNNATGQIAYVSNSEALNALSTANWLAFIPSAGVVYANFQLDSSQAFNYLYDAAPVGGTLFVRVVGYTYGR